MSGPVKLRASAAVGRTVPFSDAPTEQFTAALQEILPPWQIEGTLDDHAHNRRGDAADVTTAVSDVTGKPPRDFAQFLPSLRRQVSASADATTSIGVAVGERTSGLGPQ